MMPLTYPRPLVLLGLILGCTILAFYVGIFLHISVVYTHFFYIPIVLGGLWYPRKAILPAIYLGVLYLGVDYTSGKGLEIAMLARAGSFLLIAALVGLIAGRIQREERLSLQYISSYADRVSASRTKIMSTFDGVRMSLGMNMDVERMREHKDIYGLTRSLNHQKAEIRYQAADALGTLHDSIAGEYLARALQDPDCGVRWKAAEALGRIGKGALPYLVQALHDPDPDVRWRAALAIGDTDEEKGIPALIETLADGDRYVQGRAIIALARYGAVSIQPLITAAREGSTRVKIGAIRALGLQGDLGLTAILSIFQDSMDEKALLSPLEEAFYDLGRRTVPILENLLVDAKNPVLRAFACRILGRLGDVGTLELLIRTKHSDRNEQVRNDAESAVKRLTAIAERISK